MEAASSGSIPTLLFINFKTLKSLHKFLVFQLYTSVKGTMIILTQKVLVRTQLVACKIFNNCLCSTVFISVGYIVTEKLKIKNPG